MKGKVKRERTSFTLPPDQIKWLEEQANKFDRTRSEILSQLIDEANYYKSNVSELIQSRFPISLKTLVQFCRRYHIKTLSLFGSILGKDFGPKSDIDLLVEFETGHTPSFFTISQMEQDLSKLLCGRKIDIRTLPELSRYFRKDVAHEAEVLYAA